MPFSAFQLKFYPAHDRRVSSSRPFWVQAISHHKYTKREQFLTMKKHRKNPHPNNMEYRLWQVIDSPDTFYTGNLFRWIDVRQGGFPNGTTFRHIHTGETIVYWNGRAVKASLEDTIHKIVGD